VGGATAGPADGPGYAQYALSNAVVDSAANPFASTWGRRVEKSLYDSRIASFVMKLPGAAALSSALGILPDSGVIINPRMEFKHAQAPNFAYIAIQLYDILTNPSSPVRIAAAVVETVALIAIRPDTVFEELLRCFAYIYIDKTRPSAT
jgi:hypothetical protein